MVIPSFHPIVGGAERQLEGLIVGLEEIGVTGIIFTRMVSGQSKYQKMNSYDVLRLNTVLPKIGFGISLIFNLIIKRLNYDVIHCHSLNGQAAIASVLVGKLLRKPVILKVTRSGKGAQIYTLKHNFIGKIILWILKNGTTKFIAITKDVTKELEEIGVSKNKIIEIPNGVDLIENQKTKLKEHINILTIGRLINRKRIDMLIDAFSEVIDSFNLSLTIVGSGPNKTKLIKLAEEKKIKKNVFFLGKISKDEVLEALKKADIFVLPSDSEGMSNALLEAMSSGLPVIVADIPANQALILKDENGLMFNDYQSLKNSIIKLCSKKSLREKLGKSAKVLILSKYSFKKIALDYKNLYEQLINEF
jgi:glycosyltransferase involved in cell wall biosynthesis